MLNFSYEGKEKLMLNRAQTKNNMYLVQNTLAIILAFPYHFLKGLFHKFISNL